MLEKTVGESGDVSRAEVSVEKQKLEWGSEASNKMSPDEAIAWCQSQGSEWRLPTSSELKSAMIDNPDQFVSDERYLTSTEDGLGGFWYSYINTVDPEHKGKVFTYSSGKNPQVLDSSVNKTPTKFKIRLVRNSV